MIFDASVTAESATIVIPDTFVTDRYRMFLLRGAAEYPLGFTQLTFTDNPLILAKPSPTAATIPPALPRTRSRHWPQHKRWKSTAPNSTCG